MASDLPYKTSKLNGKVGPRSGMKASRIAALASELCLIDNPIYNRFGERKIETVQLQNEADDKGR